jgi:hypothetical protein
MPGAMIPSSMQSSQNFTAGQMTHQHQFGEVPNSAGGVNMGNLGAFGALEF